MIRENDIVYDFLEVFAKVADGFVSEIGGFEAFVPTAFGLQIFKQNTHTKTHTNKQFLFVAIIS